MSWMKRGQAGAGANAQPYTAPQAQPFGNQQTMYQNYPGGTGAAAGQPPQQQYWQAPPQHPQQLPQQPPLQAPQQYNHGQQYGQTYPAEYPPNANQYQQPLPTQYNQNYANQYTNPQQNYQQNYYQNQPVQQNLHAQGAVNAGTGNADGWEDNWDWGWDENAKKAQSLQNTAAQPPIQQPVFNNANVIEESFASTDSWNWGTDEKKESNAPAAVPPPTRPVNYEPATLPTNPVVPTSNGALEPPQNSLNNRQAEEVKNLSDREVVKERMPNLALGKRFHLENLTPQWSIESQMSQESSDGPHTQSDGTYRSENQSRNSGESPGPNTDSSNYNYVQQGFDETYTQNSEWSRNSDEPTVADGSRSSRRESHEELANSLHEMSIANDHTTKSKMSPLLVDPRSVPENLQPPQSTTPANYPPPLSGAASVASLPPASSALPQLPLQASVQALPRPPSSSSTSSLGHSAPAQAAPPQAPPTSSPATLPPSLPPPPNSQNPFQRAGPFSHKTTTKTAIVPTQPFQPPVSSSNLSSPAVVNKVSQSRGPVGFEANLETTPDNSERPDQPQVLFRLTLAPQPIPDNMEVAPQNDRNEYLQTAHLSSGEYGENTDFTRNMPPPGLRRMVLGQQEPEYQNLNISGDEPPPGLSRMVPGQHTENDNAYSQPGESYMDRHIDGQPTDSAGAARPYRQADGQQNPDNFSQPVATRASDRRPVGFDRMVPGEPSNDEYSQYQGSNYASNEQRVVTGVDHDFPTHIEASPSDVREQNMDGADYTEPARVLVSDDFAPPDDSQRELTMEGENLQDLSVISSADLTYSREHLDGADQNVADSGMDRNDASDSLDRPVTSSRKQSLNRIHSSGDDSERDRAFKASPRRDRHKTSRDRDRERNRDREKEGRYSRGDRDRKYEQDDTRPDKGRGERTRAREGEPGADARKYRRSTRSRKYDDDDTDYYSDRERHPRRYREGSHTWKPPRGEERRRDRYERHHEYREIDPSRKYGNLHREREDDRRRVTFSTDAKSNDSRTEGEVYSGTSRPESREAPDDEPRRTLPRARRSRHHRPDPYYDGYSSAGYQDPYQLQRQQYEYYEQLRVTDPAQYMLLYKQLMAGHLPPAPPPAKHAEGYPMGYEGQERGSVHSGRSSATGLKGNDTFYVYRQGRDGASPRGTLSLRTDVSDRDLNTDASLGLQLEESTVRSERMTPFRYSTAHVKASISSRDVVVVPPAYPADGRPATVRLLALAGARRDAAALELQLAPGPLVKGVTHKKSVEEWCLARAAAREAAADRRGYALLWRLLALLLRQNGVVVGSDIAELLMKSSHDDEDSPEDEDPSADLELDNTEPASAPCVDEKAALDKYREYLLYGNRQEALEWAMSNQLWGHALQLASAGERRARAAVAGRFLASLPRADPLRTLYCSHLAPAPPACGARSWRAHAAVLLASGGRPDHDMRTLTSIGDGLASKGLIYSAQFCYLSAGVPFARHPLAPLPPAAPAPAAPPRLSLLLADPRARSLAQLASTRAILATEIYEYARSLNADYVIEELQVYKLVLATRLVDAGLYERALAYVEAAARALTRGGGGAGGPATPSRPLLRALAELAERLKYHDPALGAGAGAAGPEEGEGGADSEGGSPRRHWIDDVRLLAQNMEMETASQQPSPQHQLTPQEQYSWGDQTLQYQQTPNQTYAEPEEPPADHPQYYQPPAAPAEAPAPPAEPPAPDPEPPQYQYEDWSRTEETHSQSYADPYWQGESSYAYGEPAEESRPSITMPGATARAPYAYDDDRPPSADQGDREPPKPAAEPKTKELKTDSKGRSWIGGILTKLSLRPPNQMILPDDKNPTIVWDAAASRWRSTDGDDQPEHAPPPAPPTSSMSPPAGGAGGAGPPTAPVSNIFKMQKGRHIKKSYVDVFNPGGGAPRPPPPAAELLPPAPAPAPHNYFVPAPAPAHTGSGPKTHVLIPLPSTPQPSPQPTPLPTEGAYSSDGDQYPRSGI